MKSTAFRSALLLLLAFCLAMAGPVAQVRAQEETSRSVEAGDNVIVTLPNLLTLEGSVKPTSEASTFLWEATVFQGEVQFSNPDSLSTQVGFSQPGTYILKLTVTFTNGEELSDNVQVTVNSPTSTPAPAATKALVVLDSYSTNSDSIQAGSSFDLKLNLANVGNTDAIGVVATFAGTDFIPQNTGGVRSLDVIEDGTTRSVTQPMVASTSLYGAAVGTTTVNLSYSDKDGAAYTETFTVSVNLKAFSGVAQPTATPTPAGRAQIVVGGYQSNVDILQPGSMFTLHLDVTNLGNKDAKAVTMVLGGGTIPPGNESGTPVPGGISGSGSDLATFAPLGSSNVVYLGDLPAGGTLTSDSELIVNVTAQPGAYPFKISYIYTDEKDNRLVDDQVITLLVYQLPQVEVSFYATPGMFMVGQPMPLPLQVTNLGKKTAVLGNMRITSPGNDVQNNVALVGALEPGGYFPWDAMLIPNQTGPQEIQIIVAYTDDFNQTREITQTLSIEVEDAPVFDPGMDPNMGPGMEPGIGPDGMPIDPGGMPPFDGMPPETGQNDTLWQKVVRALKGLIGLGSGADQPEQFPGEMMPGDLMPGENVRPAMPAPEG